MKIMGIQTSDAFGHTFLRTEKQIAELVKNGDFVEVEGYGQEIPK